MLESSAFLNVGERNSQLAIRMLAESGIAVKKQDLGGSAGRKLMFISDSGDVFVKRISRQQ